MWKVKKIDGMYRFVNERGEIHPNHAYRKRRNANDWCAYLNSLQDRQVR